MKARMAGMSEENSQNMEIRKFIQLQSIIILLIHSFSLSYLLWGWKEGRL